MKMTLEPDYVRRLPEFLADQEQVVDIDSMLAFERKWFDFESWPAKSFDQEPEDKKLGPVELDGRTWSHTFWAYDLTPEARYQYFKYLWEVSRPIKFPGYDPSSDFQAKDCPHCEISTDEISLDKCPRCGRALVGTGRGD